MIEPATPALVCVAVSTPTMKMRCELLPLMVKPLPLMLTELKIGDSGPDSVTLVCRLMMKPPGGVEALICASAALSVPAPPVEPPEVVPVSLATVTLITVWARAPVTSAPSKTPANSAARMVAAKRLIDRLRPTTAAPVFSAPSDATK
ncbi:hypothetical protein BSZ19_00600 [Bradyrhizobium japonicum]|uniref:Uncharacterized protein n=1 Tax=Bradyrhizobium japonicum TaxID=375 RepID=A0A1Y2JYC8_BRAJP|nr:hypothetical protein BSZ19_00600 [Bradyrhizobium japonicum]